MYKTSLEKIIKLYQKTLKALNKWITMFMEGKFQYFKDF